MDRLSKEERKLVETYAKSINRALYCAVCGHEILRYAGMDPEQHEWERKHQIHFGCYQAKRRQKSQE